MPEYMLSVHHIAGEEGFPTDPAEIQSLIDAVDRFNQKLQNEGYWVFGGGLEGRDTATVVDATGDTVVTTDGPFAESKEYLGGFWVLNAPDLDVALKLATEASAACRGKVEVRPFQAE